MNPLDWHPPGCPAADCTATPANLPVGLDEVLDWTDDVLARVDRKLFFQRFEAAEAVQYFYEPFLQAYDPDLRKDLGVWYTPPESRPLHDRSRRPGAAY
jgi:hypothetical protein